MNVLLLVLAALAAAGLAYEALGRRRDRRLWPAPGQLVDVGGHKLHVRSLGAGSTAVVFESDEGAWSTHWGALPERFAGEARVIAYDRAGLGWSDLGPPPRDVETLARELHQLLMKTVPERDRRVVLVAHGTGANVARVYAHRYPFETAGIVFVDGRPDTLADRLRREQLPAPSVPGWVPRLQAALARFGVLRLMSLRSPRNAHLPLSERQRKMLDALELDPRVREGAFEELAAEPRTIEQLGRLRGETTMPVRVLVAGATLPEGLAPKSFPRDEFNRVWAEESAKLARMSVEVRVVPAPDVDHWLQLRAPELVGSAVSEILEAAREARAREAESHEMGASPRSAT